MSSAWRGRRRIVRTGVLALALAALPACSVKRFAVDRVGDALASGGTAYASDDDPEFVRDAIPFGLKTIEGLLETSPKHEGLLLAATTGFTQYAYAYLQCEADYVEEADLARATALRERAARMYRRAFRYGLRGLDAIEPGWLERYRREPGPALAGFGKDDVPQLYWTALALGAAVSANKDDAELAADLSLSAALVRRALELDETYAEGALHEFMVAYFGGRPAAAGGSVEQARKHFERARELAKGHRASVLVSFAETVDAATQNRAEFDALLKAALEIDPDAVPNQRLANLIAQRRARWLLTRKDQLFVD